MVVDILNLPFRDHIDRNRIDLDTGRQLSIFFSSMSEIDRILHEQ